MFQYIHISFPPHNVIFWSVSILPAVKYPNNMLGVIQFSSFPSFFPNIIMVIMAKQFNICFIGSEDTYLVSMQTVFWHFYMGFGVVTLSLLIRISIYVNIFGLVAY